MAKNYGFLVCILIMALDITAGVLGIEAEIAENKVKHLRMWIFECRDPSLQAYKLGLAASVLLGLAHVVGNLLGGCVCLWTKEDLDKASANKQLADFPYGELLDSNTRRHPKSTISIYGAGTLRYYMFVMSVRHKYFKTNEESEQHRSLLISSESRF
ncbi:hypothetical protein V6N11_048344 [Hibiscus sabdariffa]|uniref:Uncharacterized protein n=1 Tax=Hibiscus sabdariffa TaxID=183260 RepID=A0ABR2PUX5_9ROSI